MRVIQLTANQTQQAIPQAEGIIIDLATLTTTLCVPTRGQLGIPPTQQDGRPSTASRQQRRHSDLLLASLGPCQKRPNANSRNQHTRPSRMRTKSSLAEWRPLRILRRAGHVRSNSIRVRVDS